MGNRQDMHLTKTHSLLASLVVARDLQPAQLLKLIIVKQTFGFMVTT